jgi:hypothetical protein
MRTVQGRKVERWASSFGNPTRERGITSIPETSLAYASGYLKMLHSVACWRRSTIKGSAI